MFKKIVITGGPSCGKSTLIKKFKRDYGFDVLGEVAREIIKERMCLDLSFDESFFRQRLIYEKQFSLEKNLSAKDFVFLDRSLIDNVAYWHHLFGFVPDDLNVDSQNLGSRYNTFFVLDRLPFVDDGLRSEKGDEEAEKIHYLIIDCYKDFGYNPVYVPVFKGNLYESVDKRADFILNHLNL